MKISDFRDTSPILRPEEMFAGELEGWAIIDGLLGGVQRRARISASGHWSPDDSLIRFSETWTFDDGQVDALNWSITLIEDGQYSGSEPTLEGEASGEQAGCAFHWTYTRNVPGKDSGSTKLNFDDWFFRIDERVMIVRGSAGRFGLPFASAYVTYRRA